MKAPCRCSILIFIRVFSLVQISFSQTNYKELDLSKLKSIVDYQNNEIFGIKFLSGKKEDSTVPLKHSESYYKKDYPIYNVVDAKTYRFLGSQVKEIELRFKENNCLNYAHIYLNHHKNAELREIEKIYDYFTGLYGAPVDVFSMRPIPKTDLAGTVARKKRIRLTWKKTEKTKYLVSFDAAKDLSYSTIVFEYSKKPTY